MFIKLLSELLPIYIVGSCVSGNGNYFSQGDLYSPMLLIM